ALTAEELLIRSAQKGELAAFEQLVMEHHANVITTAWHLLGDETEADDVAQEVWIRVYRSLAQFRFGAKFSTWLYRITVNQSITAIKRRKLRFGMRREDLQLDASVEEPPLASMRPGPREILEGKEMLREFR